MRARAWLAGSIGAAAVWIGCQSTSDLTPKARETPALITLGERVFTAFAARDVILLEPLTVWGIPRETLHTTMRQVDLVEAEASLAQLEAIPEERRQPIDKALIEQLKRLLANPRGDFPHLTADLDDRTNGLRLEHQGFFAGLTDANATLNWAEASEPNVVVRKLRTGGGAPEAAVEIFFTIEKRNYKLQLNTCIKLPGVGWRVAESLALVDLDTEAALKKMWMEDFPAAQVLARDQNKTMLVDFTGSDWCPPCIALHRRVLSTKAFHDFAKDRFVLVSVDFPRNKTQPDNLRQANAILAREFRVEGFPTVLLVDANGTELHRVTGYTNQSPAQYIRDLTPKPAPKPVPEPPAKPPAGK